jgi:hypothetical protein
MPVSRAAPCAGTFALALTLAAPTAAAAQAFPTGRYEHTFTKADAARDSLVKPGRYILDFRSGGRLDLLFVTTTGERLLGASRYAVRGDRLPLTDDPRYGISCRIAPAAGGTGEYIWAADSAGLRLRVVVDACPMRRAGLAAVWARSPDAPASAPSGAPRTP